MAFNKTELKEVGMTASTPVEAHAPSYLPAGKNWTLVWNDEFDGDSLDES